MNWQALPISVAALLMVVSPAAGAEDRAPAAIEKALAPKSDVKLAPSFNDAFEYINDLKTFNDFVKDIKKSLNEADQKTLADIAAEVNKKDPSFKSKVRMSYEGGQAVIRYDGKVVTYKNVDYDSYLISMDGKQVDLSPTIPLKDRIETVAKLIDKKFSSAGLVTWVLPEAKADLFTGTLAVGALLVGGYATARDMYYYDYLREVHNKIVDASLACDRYSERKEKADDKFKWERVNSGQTNRRGKPIYKWQKKRIDPNQSPQKMQDDEIAALGPAPAEDNEVAWADYANQVDAIKKKYEDEKKTRGELPITEDVVRRSDAIKTAMCDGWGSIKVGDYHLQNFRLSSEISFKEQCNEATDLNICIQSLRGKKVLSEAGIKRLKVLLDDVEIEAEYRRHHGLPGRNKYIQ